MIPTRTLFTIILLILMDVRQSSASNNFISGMMYKIVENETISSNTSSWFQMKSNVYCCAFCLRDPSCTGFQFGDVVNENVTTINENVTLTNENLTTSCNLLYENVSLLTREPMAGISVYSLEREHTGDIKSTTPVSGTTTPDSGTTTPDSVTTTPVPVTPATIPGSTTLPPHGPCSVDAAFTLQYTIVIIAGAWMYIYNSTENLKHGPIQMIPVQTYLPGWSGKVDAAFVDTTFSSLYMIAGNVVKTYRISDKMLLSTNTTDEYFSSISNVPGVIDAAIYYGDENVLISSDMVYTASGSVPLSTTGSTNVFQAANPQDTPKGITGVAYSWTARIPLFFAGAKIYTYTQYWFYQGTLDCILL